MTARELLEQFENGTVSTQDWTHRAHVTTAYLLLLECTPDEALVRIRNGLRQLAKTHNIPDALDRGYHETVTCAWIKIVHALILAHGQDSSVDVFLERNGFLLDKSLLRLYYTRGHLFTPEAKQYFTDPDPDLAPLPDASTIERDVQCQQALSTLVGSERNLCGGWTMIRGRTGMLRSLLGCLMCFALATTYVGCTSTMAPDDGGADNGDMAGDGGGMDGEGSDEMDADDNMDADNAEPMALCGPPEGGGGEMTVSYLIDITLLLDRKGCLSSGCHGGDPPASGYSVLTYQGIFGPGNQAETLGTCNVVPGDPDASYLIDKLTGADGIIGSRMPLVGTPLTDEELELFRTWIAEGAQNN